MTLLAGLAGLALATALLDRLWPGLPSEERRFALSVGGTLVFHGYTLWRLWAFLRENRTSWAEAFGLRPAGWHRILGVGLVSAIVVFPVNLGMMQLSQLLMESLSLQAVAQQAVETLRTSTTLPERIVLGVTAIALAPLVEEMVFRGVLYPSLKQAGYPQLALWLTALIFAATHSNLLTFLPLTLFAIVLTLLYERTGSLLAPMVTHGCFNLANYVWILWDSTRTAAS
jgi:membrane protease YdiL (CAAX protease family)